MKEKGGKRKEKRKIEKRRKKKWKKGKRKKQIKKKKEIVTLGEGVGFGGVKSINSPFPLSFKTFPSLSANFFVLVLPGEGGTVVILTIVCLPPESCNCFSFTVSTQWDKEQKKEKRRKKKKEKRTLKKIRNRKNKKRKRNEKRNEHQTNQKQKTNKREEEKKVKKLRPRERTKKWNWRTCVEILKALVYIYSKFWKWSFQRFNL